jgi:hypothetical protein
MYTSLGGKGLKGPGTAGTNPATSLQQYLPSPKNKSVSLLALLYSDNRVTNWKTTKGQLSSTREHIPGMWTLYFRNRNWKSAYVNALAAEGLHETEQWQCHEN